MKRPPPLVLVLLLLAVGVKLAADHPLVGVILVDTIIVLVSGAVARALTERVTGARRILRDRARWVVAGTIAAVAFLAMLATQPDLRSTDTADAFTSAGQSSGFYAVQTDDQGNRYAWTGQQSTLAFPFLVHRPVTVTVLMRSAAVAGGPDAPVRVEANGVEIGQIRPEPGNPTFQPFSLHFVPHGAAGRETAIVLHATPFAPGKGDPRILGTMVQRVTVDMSEAWSPIVRGIGLLWALPLLALVAPLLIAVARRYRAPWAGYGAVAACILGAGCALALIGLVLRIGLIAGSTYFTWLTGCASIAASFTVAALTLPFGYEAPNVLARSRTRLASLSAPPIDLAHLRARLTGRVDANPLPPVSATRRSVLSDIALVFLLALGIRVIWALVVPPWLAPDELDHYTYVAHIVEQGEIPHYPSLDTPDHPMYSREYDASIQLTRSDQMRATTARTLEALYAHFPVTDDYVAARAYRAPPAERLTSGGARAGPYPPLYYLIGAIPYRLFQGAPILTRLFAVRGASALLGALSCSFAYLFAYELRRERRWGWALALCVALLPMYVFDTAIVNNDVAMDLWAVALIWLTVRLWHRETFSPVLALAMLAIGGLLVLTKPTALAVLILPAVMVFIKVLIWLRTRWWRRTVAHSVVVGIGGVVLLSGALLTLRYLNRVSPVPLPLISDSSDTSIPSATTASTHSFSSYLRYEGSLGWDYFHRLFIKTFWGDFGWLDVPLADWLFVPITIVCILGLIGASIQVVLQAERRVVLLLLFGVILAQVVFLFVIADYSIFRTTGKGLGLQGRYYFPILAPFLFLVLSGWEHLCREHRAVLRLAPIAMLALQLIALATLLSRYYGVAIG